MGWKIDSRRVIVAFAIVAAGLVISQSPVTAVSTALTVSSEHTTPADFQSANTLQNVSVGGSGDRGYAKLAASVSDDFNDNSLNSTKWTIVSEDGIITERNQQLEQITSGAGDQNNLSTDRTFGPGSTITVDVDIDDKSTSGGYGAYFGFQARSQGKQISWYFPQNYKKNTWEIRVSNGSQTKTIDTGITDESLSTYSIRWTKSEIEFVKDGTVVDTVSTAIPQSNLTANLVSSRGSDATTDNNVIYDNVVVSTEAPQGTYISANHTAAHIQKGWTNLTLVNATATVEWIVDANGDGTFGTVVNSSSYSTSGNYTLELDSAYSTYRVNISFESTGDETTARVDDEGVLSATRSPDTTDSSATPASGKQFNNETITLSIPITDPDFDKSYGDTVTVEFYVDGSNIGSKTVSSNQTVSLQATDLTNGSHTWHVEVSDSYDNTATSGTFNFTVRHYDPVFDNSSADPSDGAKLTNRSQTFEIDINDTDFAEDSGDEVNASLYVDGEYVGSQNLTSNGTVSITHSIDEGGSHTYHWEAVDEYGRTASSQSYSISIPSELHIYNESAPTELITNSSVELRFYFDGDDPLIVSRSASDGTIDMTGLPADRPFIVVAQADGYVSRRIFIPSLYESQSIYLLNDSKQYVETNFVLRDYSGQFDKSESVLIIQRSLDGNWETVEGDYFGATGKFSAQLRYNQRHRLIIRNIETGEQRSLGSFTPLASGEQIVQVNPSGEIQLHERIAEVEFDPDARSLPATTNTTSNVTIASPASSLENYSIEYVLVNATNQSNTTVLKTVNGTESTGETVSNDLNLSGQAGDTVRIEVEYRTESGETAMVRSEYRIREHFANEYSLIASINHVKAAVPPGNWNMFSTMASLLVTVLVTTTVAVHVRMGTELVGVVALTSLLAFAYLGWFPWTAMFVCGGAFVAFSALRRGL